MANNSGGTQHIGLSEDLGIDLETSHKEWNKHLAITGIEIRESNSGREICYAASACPHPVIEKSIREFAGWIREEIKGVRAELEAQHHSLSSRPRFEPNLPVIALDIRPRMQGNLPSYIYEDIQFKLDQDEILQLLMGENLYGDPSLCIRELLQNAMDACELRDLRLQLKGQGQHAAQNVDGELVGRGVFRHGGIDERIEIKLTWGFDREREKHWIRVDDNGIGMTEEIIRKYFTQIGKSYYRSPDFRLEQSALRSGGFFASPISQFGIGILSCFMLADEIHVQTHPGRDNGAPRDVTISGPGSLFWMRPGSRTSQGTTVTLWLKSKLGEQSVAVIHTHDTWLKQLRDKIRSGQPTTRANIAGVIDPISTAAQWVIWPKYPIVASAEDCPTVELNENFHLDQVEVLDCELIAKTAASLSCELGNCDELAWEVWDWCDDLGKDATGSRFRFILPSRKREQSTWLSDVQSETDFVKRRELGAIVEALSNSVPARTDAQKVLSNGWYVPNILDEDLVLQIGSQAGAMIWVDLRGSVSLRLTADRQTAIAPLQPTEYTEQINALYGRLRNTVSQALKGSFYRFATVHDSWSGFHVTEVERESAPGECVVDWWKPFRRSANVDMEFAVARFAQSIAIDRDRISERSRRKVDRATLSHPFIRDFELCKLLIRDRPIDGPVRKARMLNLNTQDVRLIVLSLASRVQSPKVLDLHLNLNRELAANIDWEIRAKVESAQKCDASAYEMFPSLRAALYAALLQESFYPDLARSWVPIELFLNKGNIGNGTLMGPTVCNFEMEGGALPKATDLGAEAELIDIASRGYDLVFPTAIFPRSELRRHCKAWPTDRDLRRWGTLPFVIPSIQEFTEHDLTKLRGEFRVDSLYALIPKSDLWSIPFDDWKKADWESHDNLSVLWDLKNNSILWAKGTGNIEWIRKCGSPANAFFSTK